MDPVKEKIVDFLLAILIIVFIAILAWPERAEAGDVYRQLYSDKEYRSPVRSLSKEFRMSLQECRQQKTRIEKPLSAGGGYSIPSGYKVVCIPVEYLDD